jgi:hypothetical protein
MSPNLLFLSIHDVRPILEDSQDGNIRIEFSLGFAHHGITDYTSSNKHI